MADAESDAGIVARLFVGETLAADERLALEQPLPAFTSDLQLTFAEPDLDKFPCLGLAYEACRRGGTLPAVLNAANEIAVHAFVEERAAFTAIPLIVQRTMEAHATVDHPGLEDILAADRWARETSRGTDRRRYSLREAGRAGAGDRELFFNPSRRENGHPRMTF